MHLSGKARILESFRRPCRLYSGHITMEAMPTAQVQLVEYD